MWKKKHIKKKFTIFTTIWHDFKFLSVYLHPNEESIKSNKNIHANPWCESSL
jgi:hypothetical protein